MTNLQRDVGRAGAVLEGDHVEQGEYWKCDKKPPMSTEPRKKTQEKKPNKNKKTMFCV